MESVMNTSWSIGLKQYALVGLDGGAPVNVQGYDRYPDETYCASNV